MTLTMLGDRVQTIKRTAKYGLTALMVGMLLVWVLPIAWTVALLVLVGFAALAAWGPVPVKCGIGAMAVAALSAAIAPVVATVVHVVLLVLVALSALFPAVVLAGRVYRVARARMVGRAAVVFETTVEADVVRVPAPVLQNSAS